MDPNSPGFFGALLPDRVGSHLGLIAEPSKFNQRASNLHLIFCVDNCWVDPIKFLEHWSFTKPDDSQAIFATDNHITLFQKIYLETFM